MKKIFFFLMLFVSIFFHSSFTFAEESNKENTDTLDTQYTLKSIDLFGGDVKFNYLYNNDQYEKIKSVPLPPFKDFSVLNEEKQKLYSENRFTYISDLLHSSIYYFVLSDNELLLAELVDASLISDYNESVKISEDFVESYSTLNNNLITTIKTAKSMSDEDLLAKIKSLDLLILPSSPENYKNDFLADFDIYSYSSHFLNTYFPSFKPTEDKEKLYDTNPNISLTERVSNEKTNSKEITDKNDNKKDSNSPLILFLSLFIVIFGVFIFIKKRKEV